MMNLLKKLNLEKLGIFSFLAFFIFTPVLVKLKVGEGIYVEPLVPLLGLGLLLILLFQKRRVGDWWKAIKQVVLPNRLTVLYFLLIAFLFASFIYGYFLTGVFSSVDFLHLVKYTLYFLPFPLAIYAGRFLRRRHVNTVFVFVILVGIATAVFSLVRIFSFIQSGGQIDFWVYSIYNRSVGVLGQFFDPLSFTTELTGKAAHGTYGLYATVVLAVCLLITSRFKEFSARWLAFFTMAAFIFYASILYTLSRGAIVTAGLVFGGWFLWMIRTKKIRVVVFTIVFLLISSVVLIWVNPQVYQKFASTLKFLPSSGQTSSSSSSNAWGDEWDVSLDPSSAGRLERWGKIIDTFKEKPAFAIFGVGYSTENLKKFTGVSSTHSLFLDLWARGGILASVLAIVIWIYLLGTVFRFFFSGDLEVRTFGYLLGAFAIGWLLDNLISGEQFFSDAPMIAFWGVLGLVESLRQLGREAGPKKVLIALTSSGPGGAPKVVYDLLSHLPKAVNSRQSTVNSELEFVIAAPAGGVFNGKFRKLGYKVYPVPLDRIGVKGFTQLLKIARREEVDLINSHGKGAGLYARKAGFIMDVPVVHTFHGLHYGYRNRIVQSLYVSVEKLLAHFTTRFINVSAGQQREGLGLKFFPRSKSRLVVNGIDTAEIDKVNVSKGDFRTKLDLNPEDFVVTMAARFDPVKGHERLVEAVPDLLKKIPNLKIVFAGGGEKRSQIQRLARERGVHNAVRFLGERSDILEIFKVSDAAILPSYHEGMPLTVMEAMACRLPVVGSDVVGIRDLVKDGETGYLVDLEHGSGPLVRALSRLAKSPEQRRRMGERGRELVEKEFAMNKFVDGTLKVYQEALAPQNSKH